MHAPKFGLDLDCITLSERDTAAMKMTREEAHAILGVSVRPLYFRKSWFPMVVYLAHADLVNASFNSIRFALWTMV